MSARVAAERRRLRREFAKHAERSPGGSLREYLGSPLPVLGVRAPVFRSILREARPRLQALSLPERRSLARALWNGSTFEEREAAIALAERLLPEEDPGTWRLLDRWVDSATGWALSDSLASGPVAKVVDRDPRRFAELLR